MYFSNLVCPIIQEKIIYSVIPYVGVEVMCVVLGIWKKMPPGIVKKNAINFDKGKRSYLIAYEMLLKVG